MLCPQSAPVFTEYWRALRASLASTQGAPATRPYSAKPPPSRRAAEQRDLAGRSAPAGAPLQE
jgi:hypothetical protein